MNARTRFLIAGGAALIYALAFTPAYTVMGVAVGMLSMLPVAAAGALLGLRAVMLAGLLSLPLNILLYNAVGAMPSDYIAPLVSGPLICAAVGGLRGLSVRLRDQPSELERARQALRQQSEQRQHAEAELHMARATLEAEIAERGRAEEAEHQQRMLAEALRDTAAALTSTLNVDEVLDRILNNIERVVPHHVATIMLVEQEVARVVRHRGYTERGMADRLHTLRFAVADTPNLHQMAETGQPLVIPDIQTYAGWVDLPESRWIHSYLGAPIILKGQVIGFLNLDSIQAGFFTSVHAERLKVFADQAAVAIENARLFEAERKQHELAEALREVGAALSTTLDIEVVLDRVLEQVARVVPYDSANIMLLENGRIRVARLSRYEQFSAEVAEDIAALSFDIRTTANLYWMAETRQPLVIPDTAVYPGWVKVKASAHVRSWAGAPIVARGQVIAFFSLDKVEPTFYRAEHIELLSAFAGQVAIAIENARLYASVQQQAFEMASLYRASAQLLNPGSDLREVANRIVLAMTQEFALADCGVLLVDETGTKLNRIVRTGSYQVLTNAPLWLNGPGLTVAAVNTGEMIYAPDVSADPRYLANQSRTRSELVVPLQVGRRVIGALDLQSPEPNAFDEQARRVVVSFAERAALALENAQLLERLEHARRAAEEASQLKSEFLANTSHELRTPLTGILGSLNLLLAGACETPEEEREFLQVAYAASQNLLGIVNDVLDLAKIEAGRMDVILRPVEVGLLLHDLCALLRPRADEKRLTLDVQLGPEPLPPATADPDRLRQIVINLLGNALKFTEQGGVYLAARADLAAQQLMIEVRDTGIGIPLEKQARLFQPFVQADGSTTRKYGGTGLGLSISRQLAELMGGTLELYSSGEGQGSTFTLTLLLAEAEAAPVATAYPQIELAQAQPVAPDAWHVA